MAKHFAGSLVSPVEVWVDVRQVAGCFNQRLIQRAQGTLAIVATLSFFVGSAGIGIHVLGEAFAHALVNALIATPVIVGVERLIARLSDDELGRRGLPLGLQRGNV